MLHACSSGRYSGHLKAENLQATLDHHKCTLFSVRAHGDDLHLSLWLYEVHECLLKK